MFSDPSSPGYQKLLPREIGAVRRIQKETRKPDDAAKTGLEALMAGAGHVVAAVSACSRQPRRAASIAATAVFFIVNIASRARSASAPSVAIA
jgi:hypothetical protein